ncbi:MAG: F0F1 ATP synthase subunit gamma [Alphaproteobacteria bacterium]|nr:F0F1 ATP synthase subunit gamma [Alphaproteobacteria bacterium]
MASLKDLRNRINSVKATRKITKAMQMVAAAKLRRAQEAAIAARPYAERMDAVLGNLARGVASPEGASKLLVGTGSEDTHLLVMMTAERGLCGGFNSNIAKLVRLDAKRLIKAGKSVKILAVGRKGADNLKRDLGKFITDRVSLAGLKSVGFEQANQVADKVMTGFSDGEFDVCTIYFSKFESVISQKPTALQLIPASLPEVKGAEAEAESIVYDYEPEENEILDYLLRRNISTQIFRGLLENAASEQGARMSAMDSATRNASDMIDNLTLIYNRQRQAQITKELIEIISGAEAL